VKTKTFGRAALRRNENTGSRDAGGKKTFSKRVWSESEVGNGNRKGKDRFKEGGVSDTQKRFRASPCYRT